jgi:MFS transporter, YNFM family, putative membrane transport protein
MITSAPALDRSAMQKHNSGVVRRTMVIGLTAFLTVVDLFATQAILPTLTKAYGVTPAAMGVAVNASTIGMAVAGLAVSVFNQGIDRRSGILVSLALLSIPTALLAVAPDLTTFTILRILQGLCMASAFALTLAYLGEACNAADAGSAFAAYITGNVASNFVGRLISATLADHFGLAWNFYFFAALNLCGAVLVYFTVARAAPMEQTGAPASFDFSIFCFLASISSRKQRAAVAYVWSALSSSFRGLCASSMARTYRALNTSSGSESVKLATRPLTKLN